MALVFPEVITAAVEALAQVHATDRTGLNAQGAALAFLLVHFNPTAVFFSFGIVWHIADLESRWHVRDYFDVTWASAVPYSAFA